MLRGGEVPLKGIELYYLFQMHLHSREPTIPGILPRFFSIFANSITYRKVRFVLK